MNLIFYIERIFTLGKSCSLYVRVDNALSLDYIMYILEWDINWDILYPIKCKGKALDHGGTSRGETIMVNNLWRKNHDE